MKPPNALKGISAAIGLLEHRVNALRAKRRALAVREIVRLMRQSQIEPDDITAAFQLSSDSSTAPVPRFDGRSRVAPKYRWLAAAESEGRDRRHFIVEQPTQH